MLPSTSVLRYVTPLREGGSLPGLCEADDLGTYVVKFRRAGQGPKVLVAEVIVGELARRLGLRVPELKTIELDAAIGRREPDPEIQELLVASEGTNLAIDFLPGSLGYDGVSFVADPEEAARVLWLDAYVANVDRSWRNPNLLVWHGELWAIDHGAALYFHHAYDDPERFAKQPYDAGDHVLRAVAGDLQRADAQLAAQVDESLLREVLALVPDAWLTDDPRFTSAEAARESYVAHLLARLEDRSVWLPGGRLVTRQPFEYVVIRAVPRVDRGEFVNVGVMLYCQTAGFLGARIEVDEERVRAVAPDADVAAIRRAVEAMVAACEGGEHAGPVAGEPPGVRFRWLAAPRSTVVQPGPTHAGVTDDPGAELARLFERLVT